MNTPLDQTSAQLLFDEASRRKLQPKWENAYGLFSFIHKGKRKFVFQTLMPINSQLGSWISRNKDATHIVLESLGMPLIPYYRGKDIKPLLQLFNRYKQLIRKPVAGKEAVEVVLISDKKHMLAEHNEYVIYEHYISGDEFRYLVLKDKVVLVQKKELKPTKTDPWNKKRTTLTQKDWDTHLTTMALAIAGELQLGFVAVDFIIDAQNHPWLLEVNAGPSLLYLHKPDAGQPENIASRLFEEVYLL